ncbi:MAG: single-stranded-DNA-specific exonuclease RecJ, partial [Rhodothermaceae bacterium]
GALKECEDLLDQYGGHEAAAGMAIEIENIPTFRKKFNEVLKSRMNDDDIVPEVEIDTKISFSEITPKFLRILEQFAPFGPGNMRPVFMSENVSLAYEPRIVGKNHLITALKQAGCDKMFDTIGFNLGDFVNKIDIKQNLIDIAFTIENVTRDGRTYPQIRLKDIKVKDR